MIRKKWLALIVVVFLLSCLMPAASTGLDKGVAPDISGYEALLFFYQSPPWWANPLWLIGVVLFARGRDLGAVVSGFFASLLGASMLFAGMNHLLLPGYYLWLTSLVLLPVAAYRLRPARGKTTPAVET